MTLHRSLLGLFVSLFAASAFATAPSDPVAAPVGADSLPTILKEGSCFSGNFASYDTWIGWMRREKGLLSSLAMRWKISEDDFDRFRNGLDCRVIRYRSDSHDVLGYIVVPKRRTPGKFPVIVYNRGGNGSFGAISFFHLFDHMLPLAEQGYVVVASQYRGVEGEPEGQPRPDQFGGDDVRDVVNLVRLLPKVPRADVANVFMIGQSRGAMMALLAIRDPAVRVRAVAIYSGLLDLHEMLRFRPEFEELYRERIPGYAENKTAVLDARSPTRWAAKLPADTAILIVHGDEDERAPVASARLLAAQLKKLGRPHELVIYAGESHFLAEHRDDLHARTLAWFRRYHQAPNRAPAVAALAKGEAVKGSVR